MGRTPVTEHYLRSWFNNLDKPEFFQLEPGMLLTPAGLQFLQDNKIALQRISDQGQRIVAGHDGANGKRTGRYRSPDGTEQWATKPESMTQLHGMVLVPKTHDRIRLRGMLDSLQGEILLVRHEALGASSALAADLEEFLTWTREILAAEVTGRRLERSKLFSCDFAELRDRSHHPKQYYGFNHFLPGTDMDGMMLQLNRLRCLSREVELAAVTALHGSGHAAEADILQALNRMSSGIYVLMLRYKAGEYGS